jgi:hypothetical protein
VAAEAGGEIENNPRAFVLLSASQTDRCLADLTDRSQPVADPALRAQIFSERLETDEDDPESALELAERAARSGCRKDAFLFAQESLRRGGKHPRAFCIVGVCELAWGERAAAQQHLAAATRLARSRTEFRRELRIAQRLLFILHFGAGRRGSASYPVSEESDV